MNFDICVGVVLSGIIIAIWGYIGALTFALYSTTITNHHQMRMFYTIAVFNILQAMLGIYYITTGNQEWQQARWTAFSFIEIAYLGFVLGTFKLRWLELAVRTIFWVLVLTSVVIYNVWLNVAIALILGLLAYTNKEVIIKKYFPWVFLIYSMTTIVPHFIGFTTNGSLFMGVIYTCVFAYSAKKLYDKEKVNDAINAQIKSELSEEFSQNSNKDSKEV